ncbi:uncharacterized protein si:ch211-40k21.5 [Sebastes umbrosus]|uniref:uncharacterized protein si:ch211-40k21.5 n=1 Tax=Sebastes umbrosus TaxID=72105 RepID=UPI00189DBAEB|nr:uncharacterized protein si:ch211-40k21.5 [Sebastes umbrosus]
MAEQPTGKLAIPALAATAYTSKQPKKRKTDFSRRQSKRESDNKRNKTRVNIGEAFQRWRDLRDSIGLTLDSELAVLLLDRSTAELESFHNHILMYASKRFSFTPPVYSARTLLAGLDYNHHVHRPVQRKADGSIEYRKLYNKKSRKWSLYTMKVDKDYGYIPDLQRAILRSRTTADRGMPRVRRQRPDDPRQYGLLCGIPPPTTEELLHTQVSRRQGQGLPK